jgi:hypothetical protein
MGIYFTTIWYVLCILGTFFRLHDDISNKDISNEHLPNEDILKIDVSNENVSNIKS